MSDPLGDRLEHCYSGAVYDGLRAKGFFAQMLPSSLRHLDPVKMLVGKSYTVSGYRDDSLDHQEAYLKYGKF